MNSENFTYNYIICGSRNYFIYGYNDIIGKENVRYFSSIYDGIDSKLKRTLINFCYSKKVNSLSHISK